MGNPVTAVPMEYWVMRVLLHPGPTRQRVLLEHMTAIAQVSTLALVATGDLVCLPDGCICEPLEVFGLEVDAREHRTRMSRDNPDGDYRVILNADVTV